MFDVWFWTILSVFLVSLISLIGVFTFSIRPEKIEKILLYLVSLSTGTLLGDVFIHLLPEAYEQSSEKINISLAILAGIIIFFIFEKFIHWRHCHKMPEENHPHPFSYMILAGDGLHNFIDGMIIAAGFLADVSIGVATVIAVIFHEIPQEIGDFGSLLYGGLSKAKALFLNFLSALLAVLGSLLVLFADSNIMNLSAFLVPFAAGGFIYIASADLIPEMHKNVDTKKSIGQLVVFICGILIMFALKLLD